VQLDIVADQLILVLDDLGRLADGSKQGIDRGGGLGEDLLPPLVGQEQPGYVNEPWPTLLTKVGPPNGALFMSDFGCRRGFF
jgi:hypothetical protein